jgi:hypothetical protein
LKPMTNAELAAFAMLLLLNLLRVAAFGTR